MNLDFLSGILGGHGKNNNVMMTMLLPLLLGGKSPIGQGGIDATGLMTQLFKGKGGQGDSYPPLFGESNASNNPSSLLDILSKMTLSAPSELKQEERATYPYELQYNRPDHASPKKKSGI